MADIPAIIEKAREEGKSMQLPINRHTAEGAKTARKAANTAHSEQFRKRLRKEQQRLRQGVFKKYVQPEEKRQPVTEPEQAGTPSSTEKVYLFLSSSIPKETIRAYLATLDGMQNPMVVPVMRGFVKGLADLPPSVHFFSEILKKDPTCRDQLHPRNLCPQFDIRVKLKPLLFHRYGISRVPALVYVNGKHSYQIAGDAGLGYLLTRINREAHSPNLARLIDAMRNRNNLNMVQGQ